MFYVEPLVPTKEKSQIFLMSYIADVVSLSAQAEPSVAKSQVVSHKAWLPAVTNSVVKMISLTALGRCPKAAPSNFSLLYNQEISQGCMTEQEEGSDRVTVQR